MNDPTRMALTQMQLVIQSTLLNSLERASIPLSTHARAWIAEVSPQIISDLAESGWSFTLTLGEET